MIKLKAYRSSAELSGGCKLSLKRLVLRFRGSSDTVSRMSSLELEKALLGIEGQLASVPEEDGEELEGGGGGKKDVEVPEKSPLNEWHVTLLWAG